MYPVVLLCGKAGSGKDTVADLLVNEYGAAKLSLADPMKVMAQEWLGFETGDLWGQSERRGLKYNRFADPDAFLQPADPSGDRLDTLYTTAWDWTNRLFDTSRRDEAFEALEKWWVTHVRWFAKKNGHLTPRHVLQTMGTEWARAVDRDVWVRYALANATKLLGGGHWYRQEKAEALYDPNYSGRQLVVIPDGRFRNEVLAVKAVGGYVVHMIRDVTSNLQKLADFGEQLRSPSTHKSETELSDVPYFWYNQLLRNDGSLAELEETAQELGEELTATIYE